MRNPLMKYKTWKKNNKQKKKLRWGKWNRRVLTVHKSVTLHSVLYLNGSVELLVETKTVDLTGSSVGSSEGLCIHYSGVEIICWKLDRTGYSEKLISMLVQVSHRNRDTRALKLTWIQHCTYSVIFWTSLFIFLAL